MSAKKNCPKKLVNLNLAIKTKVIFKETLFKKLSLFIIALSQPKKPA
jgi:hypothetical protein